MATRIGGTVGLDKFERGAGRQMNDATSRSWSTYTLIIFLCAGVGFGAVYAIVGFDDNRSTMGISDRVKNPAAPGRVWPIADGLADQGKSGTMVALAGADGRPLNRGTMTTFVFKTVRAPVAESLKFNDGAGQEIGLSAFRGKVVLLNLWATWCAPCRKEMPDLNTLQKVLVSDQFEVVALSVDRGSPEKAKKFLAEVGATDLKFYHDPSGQAGFSFKAIGMPTTLLLDREGREIGRLVGPAEWHSPEAQDLINAAIAAR